MKKKLIFIAVFITVIAWQSCKDKEETGIEKVPETFEELLVAKDWILDSQYTAEGIDTIVWNFEHEKEMCVDFSANGTAISAGITFDWDFIEPDSLYIDNIGYDVFGNFKCKLIKNNDSTFVLERQYYDIVRTYFFGLCK